jgi:hypothetical protein
MSDLSVRGSETNRQRSLVVVGHRHCEGCDSNPMNGAATMMSGALSSHKDFGSFAASLKLLYSQ